MAFAPRLTLAFTLAATLVAAPAPASGVTAFRQWIAGQEAGGAERRTYRDAAGEHQENHEWVHLDRLGVTVSQDLAETALRRADGSIEFTFRLSLSQEPVEGRASWSPAEPARLRVAYRNLAPKTIDLPEGVLIWPGDEDTRLLEAARSARPVHFRSFSVPTQQVTGLDLEPVGPAPLPGFPDAVRFKGRSSEGALTEDVEFWISPAQGEVRQLGTFAGIPLVSQRAELPPPAAGAPGSGFFERTLRAVPAHPFLAWVPELTVRWTGAGEQVLPEDPLQRRTGPNRYRLAQAAPPTPAAQAELPVTGEPDPADAPFLAATPLVQFRDPVFDGLMHRLAPPPGATRYQLARLVNAFVYDWILEKDYTVGFASAQEVARNPRGDCTEHGVLAVALLRRLGVPARGVVGWIAADRTLGMHFWAEARIGGAWYPIDPTFDMVPASAFRLKLGATDLADLGSVGWDNAGATFQDGTWAPEEPWAAAVRVQGDTVYAPGRTLRVPGAHWTLSQGELTLVTARRHPLAAAPRPAPGQPGRRLQARGGRQGWFDGRRLWTDCGGGQWIRVEDLDEAEAFAFLENLEVRPRS